MDNTLYVSGQIGFIPETMELAPGGAVGETDQVIIKIILLNFSLYDQAIFKALIFLYVKL